MKFLFLSFYFICFGIVGSICSAQLFPIDSTSQKITYSNIEILDTISTSQIYKNAELWIDNNFKNRKNYDTQFNLKEGFITCKAGFLVYTKGIASKQIHGEITYNIRIDIKEKKYRYTFTNFVFEYYKIDRQYKYEPTGRLKPLEAPKYPGWQTVWNKHKITTNNIIQQHIFSLKEAMKQASEKKIPIVQKKKIDW